MIGIVKVRAGIAGKLVVRDELGGGFGEGEESNVVCARLVPRTGADGGIKTGRHRPYTTGFPGKV